MSNQKTVTVEFHKSDAESIKDILLANNWGIENDPNEYVLYRFRSPNGSVGLMYLSGKLVLQGKEDFTSIISNIKKREEGSLETHFKPHIGVDEVGKGDYFGPLVVVGCFVNEEFYKQIKILGFTDSKKFTDGKIQNLFNTVKEYPYYYSSVVTPKEYNEGIKKYNNVSILLAKQHSLVIEKGLEDLKSKDIHCEYVVIDQFSSSKSRVVNELGDLGKNTKFIQYHKGESDIAVAAASIIARGIFLREWERMNNQYSFEFPKGASNVISAGKEFVEKYGRDELANVAKISFKTTKQVFSLF
jgi:ribonuclease HIII